MEGMTGDIEKLGKRAESCKYHACDKLVEYKQMTKDGTQEATNGAQICCVNITADSLVHWNYSLSSQSTRYNGEMTRAGM